MTSKKVFVTFRKPGVHRYPAAATDDNLIHQSYLQYPHRHLFHFRVSIDVFHNERDIEFHNLLTWIEQTYDAGLLQLDSRSCETIADELHERLSQRHPGRTMTVEVSEDGECGVVATYQAEAPQ
jgi:hypothetical protein